MKNCEFGNKSSILVSDNKQMSVLVTAKCSDFIPNRIDVKISNDYKSNDYGDLNVVFIDHLTYHRVLQKTLLAQIFQILYFAC